MSFRYRHLASQRYRARLPSLAQSSCRAVNFCTHCPPGPSSLSWATHGLQCSQCIVYTLQSPTLPSSYTSLARSSLHYSCNLYAFGVGMPRGLCWTSHFSAVFVHPPFFWSQFSTVYHPCSPYPHRSPLYFLISSSPVCSSAGFLRHCQSIAFHGRRG